MAGTIVADTIQDGAGNSTAMDNAIYGSAKAWVNFNGVSATVRKSYNVSSVTLVSTGVYTVNFTNSFADTNYCAIGTTINVSSMSLSINGAYNSTPTLYSTTQAQFVTSQNITLYTCSLINIVVFD